MKNNFYDQYSNVCKTIVNPIRQKIISIIGFDTINVTKIQKKIQIPMSNLSNHLSALYNVGVLSRKKEGIYIYYYLTDPKLVKLLEQMKGLIINICQKRDLEFYKN